MKEVLVPEDRVGVVIGEEGETLEEFEEVTGCSVRVEDNTVKIEGDPLEEMNAEKIAKAMGRGFAPDKAFRIIEEDHTFHSMDIDEYANSENSRNRLKGRVIGRNGEARRHIEKEANVLISVYGSTVGLIGMPGNIEIAMEALRMLLNGKSHSTAYRFIEKNQSKISR